MHLKHTLYESLPANAAHVQAICTSIASSQMCNILY